MAKKILLVDDEVEFVDMMKMRLEANGFVVVTAGDGEEALDKMRKEKPDAILLDIMMPKMDGMETLKRIRQENKDILVLIVTAFSNEDRFRMAGELNAAHFILKTSDLQKEVENLKMILSPGDKGDKRKR